MLKRKENPPNFAEIEGSPAALSIAICGTRGIPACYGGFETFAEELSTRLVERGHKVRVYCRKHLIKHDSNCYRGVELRKLPAPQHKYAETPVHSLLSMVDLLFRPVDVVLVCNAANSPFIWIPRLKGMPVSVNLDGIERLRSKWNLFGRAWYRLGEQTSVWFADEMISDAEIIKRYYGQKYRRSSELIRYGCRPIDEQVKAAKLAGDSLGFMRGSKANCPFEELNLAPNNYLLYVSRLEPENNAHRVVDAYNRLSPELKQVMPLLMVGDAPYAQSYIRKVRDMAGPNVVFAGYRFGEQYEQLSQGAYAYIQATEVGGTHPALVEAMGYANCIIANQTPEHSEVLKPGGLFYRKNDTQHLSELMEQVLSHPQTVQQFRRLAFARAQELFCWDKITSSYEELFGKLAQVFESPRALKRA